MINIAKLLKDCPKGTKLYSPLFGEVNFVGIDKQSGYPIGVTDCKGNGRSFTEFGVYLKEHPDAECLLFPSKDCRTWEGWKPPIEPKFKVGDSLQSGCMYAMVRRIDTENQRYVCQFDNIIPFKEQNLWSLVPNPKPHYDISNFHAGMPVLVRDGDGDEDDWTYALFSHYNSNRTYKFSASGEIYRQCIPFNEETKHLLGTTDMPSEEFINW